jgi:nucleotide-binding universal stress UspA family protein
MHYAGDETRVVHEHVSEELLRARADLVAFCHDADIPAGEADLRVIGTRSASGLRRVLMGSVAEKLLPAIESDILAVPPHD